MLPHWCPYERTWKRDHVGRTEQKKESKSTTHASTAVWRPIASPDDKLSSRRMAKALSTGDWRLKQTHFRAYTLRRIGNGLKRHWHFMVLYFGTKGVLARLHQTNRFFDVIGHDDVGKAKTCQCRGHSERRSGFDGALSMIWIEVDSPYHRQQKARWGEGRVITFTRNSSHVDIHFHQPVEVENILWLVECRQK